MMPEFLEPAKCRGKLRKEMLEDDNEYGAEFKYHGCRYLMYICKDGNRFFSRHISVKGGYVEKTNRLPHLANHFIPLEGTVLDGEIILKLYGTVRDVTSILGSSPDLAIEKQKERGWLKFMAFDILYYKGHIINKPLYYRKQLLKKVIEFVESTNQIYIKNTKMIFRDKKAYYNAIVEKGGEGIVLKHLQSMYGERSKWIKLKKEKTWDVVITGFEDPSEMSIKKGDSLPTITHYKSLGWIGSIKFGQYILRNNESDTMYEPEMTEFGSVSGMDEATRAKISKNPKKYIGKVIEIKAQSRLPSGKFEHPRFIRFRPDKRVEDCIYSEDEA